MIELEGKHLCSFCFEEIKPSEAKCNCCGRLQSEAEEKTDFLPIGTILYGEYMIGKVLGNGGFGVTYLGYNLKEKKKVAIKEFFPEALCYRIKGEEEVLTRQGDNEKKFKEGAEKFYNEAKNIAMFANSPNIINVYTFFYEKNTSYFVMEYVDGIDLKNYVKLKGGKITPGECCLLLLPILDALSDMHEKQILHRDISPDNIYITHDGQVKLLDFGAARQRIDDDPKSLSVVLKPGFAPVEQYQRKGKQGGWTDVYAFAATVYYCVTGVVPDPVTDRIGDDKLKRPAAYGILPNTTFSSIIMKAMAIQVADRTQSAKLLKKQLEVYARGEVVPEKARLSDKLGQKGGKKLAIIVGLCVLAAGLTTTGILLFSGNDKENKGMKTISEVSVRPINQEAERQKEEAERLELLRLASPSPSPTPAPTPTPQAVMWKDHKIGQEVAKTLGVAAFEDVTVDQLLDVHVLRLEKIEFKNLDDISMLTGLTDLTITNSKIKSLAPISKLVNLTSLTLTGDEIVDLDGIEKLTGLKNLDLEDNKIVKLKAISSLTNLKELKLASNQIKSIEPLSELSNLERLYMIHNKVTTLPDMKKMTKLTIMNLSDNALKDISGVKGLSSISKLYLVDNEISNIKPLKNLKTLTVLDIRKNMILDTDTMYELKDMVQDYKGSQSDQKIHPQVVETQPDTTYDYSTYSTPEPVWTPTPTQAPVYVPTPAPTPVATPAPAQDEEFLW